MVGVLAKAKEAVAGALKKAEVAASGGQVRVSAAPPNDRAATSHPAPAPAQACPPGPLHAPSGPRG